MTDNETTDSSLLTSISSQDQSIESENYRTEFYYDNKPESRSYEEDVEPFSNLLKVNNLSLLPSTSLNRELEGINLLASRSTALLTQSRILSDKNKYSFGSDEFGGFDNKDESISTPHNRALASMYQEATKSDSHGYRRGSSSFRMLSTPVTKKMNSSQMDLNSNSSIRFNPASLISLPFGYNNNTFTKIRAGDVVYPSLYKKKLKIVDYKNDKKSRKVPYGQIGLDSDFNDADAGSDSGDSYVKSSFFTDDNSVANSKTLYNLMVHNDYSSNPYKRRYQSVVNERRRLLSTDYPESLDHITHPERAPKKPRKAQPREVHSDQESKDELTPSLDMSEDPSVQTKALQLPCYSLPSLQNDNFDHINELMKSHNAIETDLFSELIDTLSDSIAFRQKLYANLGFTSDSKTAVFNLYDIDTVNRLNAIVKNAVSNLTNDLITLNYAKALLKTDYTNANADDNYDPNIDFSYDIKRLRRLFRHEQYGLMQAQFFEDTVADLPLSEMYVLLTSPSMTFYNGLKCIQGLCSTSKYLHSNGVKTECDSCGGCYMWNEQSLSSLRPNLKYGLVGAWTHDHNMVFDIIQQNKRKQMNLALSFINDISKVAIAELRIPKPEWGEFTEYNCVNGYCCAKCCTCKKPTDHSMMYSVNTTHERTEDSNINFAIDAKIATVDLLKNVLGSCSCYCKCNTEVSHPIDRALNDHSILKEFYNDCISWYEVDHPAAASDSAKKYVSEHITQERCILRVKLDSIPLSWKNKVPFTCKLDLLLNTSSNDADQQSHRADRVDQQFPSSPTHTSYNSGSEDSPFSGQSTLVEEDFSSDQEGGLSHFKHLEHFTFWDALDILKKEMTQLHSHLAKNDRLNRSEVCFDALEIDTSEVPTKTLKLDNESFVTDSKRDSYVEIALYLPYVPSHILPWEFELASPLDLVSTKDEPEETGEVAALKSELFSEYWVVSTSFMRVLYFYSLWVSARNEYFEDERDLYEDYKALWHIFIRSIETDEVDIFSWGVLPVRAMDMPDRFVPLPAGFKNNDISYPYVNNEIASPYDVEGYGVGDLIFKKQKFSQLSQISEAYKNDPNLLPSSRHRDAQATRRKLFEDSYGSKSNEGEVPVSSNTYLVPFFSNLTGPSVRWTYCLIDSVREPLECIPDFSSLPIYKAMKCPEMNMYSLDGLVTYDRKNLVSEWDLLEDELEYRVSQVWSKSEVRIFVEKYLMYPKNFSKIAQFLENKKCGDCVEFYYRFKYRLKLKEKVADLRSRIRGKFDMTKNMKREACIMNSLDSIIDDCNTDFIKDFNKRNSLGLNSVSDYLLRCGSLDSSEKYEMAYTQHVEAARTFDEDYQHNLDNIAEGYFMPAKYLTMTTRKNVQYPTTNDPEDVAVDTHKGCFMFDYREPEYPQEAVEMEYERDGEEEPSDEYVETKDVDMAHETESNTRDGVDSEKEALQCKADEEVERVADDETKEEVEEEKVKEDMDVDHEQPVEHVASDVGEEDEGESDLDSESDLMRSFVVTINYESYINSKSKWTKRQTLSNLDKILHQYDEQSEFAVIQQSSEEQPVVENPENTMEVPEMQEEPAEDLDTPSEKMEPSYQGMVTRKKVLTHAMYDYDSPRLLKHTTKLKSKKKTNKWTLEEKMAYRDAFRVHGKDWNRLHEAMGPYGKTMDQIKNYYHKNNLKARGE